MEPTRLEAIVSHVQANGLDTKDMAPGASSNYTFSIDGNGIAFIPITGVMMKPQPKVGGTSTILVRKAIRMAISNTNVRGIMLVVDSPGGAAAGNAQLADEVKAANQIKPVFSYFDDVAASAALFATVYSQTIYALPTGLVGCIGSRMALIDSSQEAQDAGVKVIPLVSNYDGVAAVDKARFEVGTPITEEDLAYAQEIVQVSGDAFYQYMLDGRLSKAQLKAVASGAVYTAADAKSKGLVDSIGTLQDATRGMLKEIGARERAAKQSQRQASVRRRIVQSRK